MVLLMVLLLSAAVLFAGCGMAENGNSNSTSIISSNSAASSEHKASGDVEEAENVEADRSAASDAETSFGSEESESVKAEEPESVKAMENGEGSGTGSTDAGSDPDASDSTGSYERNSDTLNATDSDDQKASAGSVENPDPLEQEVNEKLSSMTLDEKISQMFILLPSSLTGVSTVVAAGASTEEAINAYPVGGLIYMAENLESESQIRTMLENTQAYSMERIGLPMFLTTDEEGGTVRRISGRISGYPDIPNMSEVGAGGDVSEALRIGATMGEYMSNLGFTMDFAPCADVLSNPANTVVRDRSFGSDPNLVSQMSEAVAGGLLEYNVIPVFKHFPGHGATADDTHAGYAYTEKTLEELRACELIPFQNAIDSGAECIMVSHISLPNVTGDNTPASLSSVIITDLLREEMGFDGIVITDAFNMEAVTEQYSSGQAAVKAVKAGADMILMPADFRSAYSALIEAVNSGDIEEERINDSLRRILRVKLRMF